MTNQALKVCLNAADEKLDKSLDMLSFALALVNKQPNSDENTPVRIHQEDLRKIISYITDANNSVKKIRRAGNIECVGHCWSCDHLCSIIDSDGDEIMKCELGDISTDRNSFCSKYESKTDTLCWDCRNSVLKGCKWASKFEPVDGWVAIRRAIDNENSYLVRFCPEFERG